MKKKRIHNLILIGNMMTKKYLITGASGFVGRHFVDWLEKRKIPSRVLGVDLSPPDQPVSHAFTEVSFQQMDLLNEEQIEQTLGAFRPDYILHLASYSSVAFSWEEPVLSFQNNMNVFLNLLEGVRRLGINPRILSVGSSEIYGNVNAGQLPLTETASLDPVSPYAVARVSQELLSRVYADSYQLDLVISRSFNHIGPGQRDDFVVSSFARQIARLKQTGQHKGVLRTGDLEIIRDFVDVRDVVKAYHLLLEKGVRGRIYNICSGAGRSLREVLDELASLAGIEIETETDPSFIRPSDNREIVGSNQRIRDEIGWVPEIPLQQSLQDILEDWKKRMSKLKDEG